MKKTDCESIQNLIPLYIDNMLSNEETDTICEHIKTCKVCKEELAFFQDILRETKDMPQIEVSATFHNNVMKGIQEKTNRKTGYAFIWKPAVSFVAAAAVIAFSVVSFLNLNQDTGHQNPDTYVTKASPSASAVPNSNSEPTVESKETKSSPKEQKTDKTKGESIKKETMTPSLEQPSAFARTKAVEEPATGDEEYIPAAASVVDEQGEAEQAVADGAKASLEVSSAEAIVATVSVSESAKEQAMEILSLYEKNASGYQVGESYETVLNHLSALDGFVVSTTLENTITENTIVLK